MGCFTDQVMLTHALVGNLDEAIKEVKLLWEHEEESSQKITELEALCKKLRKDTQRLEEEKATLPEMVESHDELLMEITREMGLDHMGEDEDEEEEEEDANDRGDAATPLATAPPPPVPLLSCLWRSMKRALWRRSQSKKLRCRLRSSWQMLSLRCHRSVSTMRSWGTMRRIRLDWRMTLMIWTMTQARTTLTWMSRFPMMKVIIGIEPLSLSLKIRIKKKF
jgi:hypothetical protein